MQSSPTIPANLWTYKPFLNLWLSKMISGIGSRVTSVAVPFIAAALLEATPGQTALLVFVGQLPDLVFGLLAGAWIDRQRRKPMLIRTDFGRAALLSLIPIGMYFGFLGMPLLLLVAFMSASMTLLFTLASVAILPAVVTEDRLVDANSKLHMGEAAISLVGPGFSGAFIQLVSAPKAVIADIFSYLASAWMLRHVALDEVDPESSGGMRAVFREIREGLVALIATPLLTALAVSMGIIVLGSAISQTVLMIFYVNVLSLSPAQIGFIAAATGLGTLVGAFIAQRVARFLTLGGAIISAGILGAVSMMIVPAASSFAVPVGVLLSTGVVNGIAYTVLSINQISLRQRTTPIRLLGRVTAASSLSRVMCSLPIHSQAVIPSLRGIPRRSRYPVSDIPLRGGSFLRQDDGW
jgi:Na+/melibiose symporter-like transporter